MHAYVVCNIGTRLEFMSLRAVCVMCVCVLCVLYVCYVCCMCVMCVVCVVSVCYSVLCATSSPNTWTTFKTL